MLQDPYQVDRLIQIFLHDVRSPLGVAQGYLHLLDNDKLPADARPRALQGVSEAVNRMAKLVDDASMLLEPGAAPQHQSTVAASTLCDRVRVEAEGCGVTVQVPEVIPSLSARVGSSLDHLARALSTVLHLNETEAQRASAGPMTLALTIDGADLRLSVVRGDAVHPLADALVPCDPFHAGKLDYLVAYRHLSSVSGAIWCKVGESRACGVTVPLEVRPE